MDNEEADGVGETVLRVMGCFVELKVIMQVDLYGGMSLTIWDVLELIRVRHTPGYALLGTVLRLSKQEDLAVQILKRTSSIATNTLGKTQFVAEACEEDFASLQQTLPNKKLNISHRSTECHSMLRKQKGGHEKATAAVQRFKVDLVAVVVVVLLILQWVLKSKLRGLFASQKGEPIMKQREFGRARVYSRVHV